MAMIFDSAYALHAIRLSALRTTDDPLTPRIVTLDGSFGLNPYISAMGLGDVDRWPEIKRALDSPPPEPEPHAYSAGGGEDAGMGDWSMQRRNRGATGLRYTQTIMGKGSGGAGMRVSGRRVDASDVARRLRSADRRANSSSHDMRPPVPPRSADRPRPADEDGDVFAPGYTEYTSYGAAVPRPRSDSAPISSTAPARESIVGHHRPEAGDERDRDRGMMGMGIARSVSETSGDVDDDLVTVEDGGELGLKVPSFSTLGTTLNTLGYPGSSIGVAASALPSDLGMATGSAPLEDPLAGEAVDEGSDVDEDEVVDEDESHAQGPPVLPALARRPSQALRDSHGHMYPGGPRVSVIHEEERRSSTDTDAEVQLEFSKVAVAHKPTAPPVGPTSALTAALNQHVPHLVSTGAGAPAPLGIPTSGAGANPFASLYASVAAPATVPSLSLELFFPHSDTPSTPIIVSVRKDATVEEATGHGLYRYWEEGREPKLTDTDGSVNWGLRIVEDDGEVDEDFPPLDRESQISKFSYGQFGIVEATATQKKQNEAMAPLIQRRPSRIIVDLARGPTQPPTPSIPTPPMRRQNSAAPTPEETIPKSVVPGSAGGKQVLLRVRVSAGADVNFTTTISVPSDMYIADLTEVLVRRKLLQLPSSEWVLCLADLTLALPLDRTVASLEDTTDLTLVRRAWAAEHGLRPGGVRGGDPSASIFKRTSEPPLARVGNALEFGGAQTYKKWTVQRKTPIGRHERVLAVDGDYIYILPSENRAFFDTMKSTSFHITLVANCKLSGRAGNPGFKIYVWRDGSRKRYEFEAENGKQAAEIIASIKDLMKAFQAERNTMLAPMRTMSQLGTLGPPPKR